MFWGAMEGYISIYRKITEWKWFHSNEMLSFWVKLLLFATHKEHCDPLGNLLKPGQFSTSIRKLAKDCCTTERRVRTFLKRLKTATQIDTQYTGKCTIITIINWPEYQGKGAQGGTVKTHVRHNNNNGNNGNKNNIYVELAQKVIKRLNELAHRNFRPTKNTMAHIIARLHEGHHVDDLARVVKYKCTIDKFFYEKNPNFLNPTTLFRPTKFETYLEQANTYDKECES